MTGFVPPPYPYDRLNDLRALAGQRFDEVIDCSIGTPTDTPPEMVVEALASSDAERGYPASVGTPAYRDGAAGWLQRELGVAVDPDSELAACVGTKEFVVSTPHYLRLRDPSRDTVLYPAVSYPSYAMGAVLAGCRAVPVPVDDQWRIDLSRVDPSDAARALCLWVNTPGNPAGGLDDLTAAARWGRANDVLVISDECYVEFTWDGPPRTILSAGVDGVLSIHSLSKRRTRRVSGPVSTQVTRRWCTISARCASTRDAWFRAQSRALPWLPGTIRPTLSSNAASTGTGWNWPNRFWAHWDFPRICREGVSTSGSEPPTATLGVWRTRLRSVVG